MTWKEILSPIKNSEYFTNLWKNVQEEYENHICFPPKNQLFRALELTSFEDVKVVLLGQDPYHNHLQANGLCFSVSDAVKTPPSLQNMYKELYNDVGITKTTNELESWAKQGVLLLNATLSVRAHEPNSHKNLGWMTFTDFIIQEISNKKEHVVFVLWGNFAQQKAVFIDSEKHFVLKSAHPSPFSVHKGFFGSKPYSRINSYLQSQGILEIEW